MTVAYRARPAVGIYRATLFKPSETFVYGQAASLRRHRPILVGLTADPGGGGGAVAPHDPSPEHHLVGPGLRNGLGLFAGRAPKAMLRTVGDLPLRLVHAHFGPDGTQVLPTCRRLGLPLVVTLHGHDVFTTTWWPRSPQRLSYLGQRNRLLAQADRVLCVSDFLYRAVIRQGVPDGAHLVRHHIGIDVDGLAAQASSGDRETICFVGRLVPKKGVDDLARVVRHLRSRGIANPVEIIGDGPQRSVVAELARDVPGVHWRGSRPHDEVVELLGRSRLAILPSQTGPNGDAESLGLVFPEAIALGCIPVGYRHGGVGEVVPDGLLVEEGDIRGLCALAESVIRAPEAAEHELTAGLEGIRRRFDLHRQTAILEELYDDAAR
jgi:glycosyltransferase involved in cell wall biosynthesis